jgi:hypothetical protein
MPQHRTTLWLSPSLKRRVSDRARDVGISFGEFTRRALERAVSESHRSPQRPDLFWRDQAVFRGRAPKNLSTRHDDYVYGNR